MADMGGEFEREVKEELECMGSRIVSSAPYSPTQNAVCERAGQTWLGPEEDMRIKCWPTNASPRGLSTIVWLGDAAEMQKRALPSSATP